MQSIIKCSSVGKSFRKGGEDFLALKNVTLEIRHNSFTALVGPSGCGKTTLLHILAGLDTSYDGSVLSEVNRNEIAYVFQQPRLLPWLTAIDNLTFVLKSRGASSKEARDIAQSYIDLVGLTGFEKQYPAQLSGGMRQRVALARALTVDPKLMLMDEPFGSLDELTARRLRVELLRLFERVNKTIIFVTHNVTEAAFLADDIVVMGTNPGRVLAHLHVDLPRPRDYDGPEIAAIAKHVIQHLE